MPEPLRASEVENKKDPSVTKQYDDKTPKAEQIQDLYNIVDKLKTCLLVTQRENVGPVGRSMAVAKRNGPDFYFLANVNSRKFDDIRHSDNVAITFQDSSTQNWVSIAGKATKASNADPRIKEYYSKGTSAWFGDLGDGTHNGGPEDPRMALIEVKPWYITYWKSTVTSLGLVKEVVGGAMTGQVANTGDTRELMQSDIEKMRETTQ
ncbi:MAG: hypothetical protein LQ340_006754 [Diploschistes diacapsis]|nr:MAG: hypothetical protein LQ340_006754 [Diploschistes diacapsis]